MGRHGPFAPGSFYRQDDRTGFAQRAERTRKEWNGGIVDESVFEARQPQDLVKGVKDQQSVPDARPLAPNVFVGPTFTQLGADPVVGQTVLDMASVAGFYEGVEVAVMLDNGVLFFTSVADIGAGTITIAQPLPYSAAQGNLVTNYHRLAPVPEGYHTDAVHFDGASFLENLALACVNTQDISCSVWLKAPATAGATLRTVWLSDPVSYANGADFQGSEFAVVAFAAAAAGTPAIRAESGRFTEQVWVNLLYSQDGATGRQVILLNGAPSTFFENYTPGGGNFLLNALSFFIGSDGTGDPTTLYLGDMADFWWSTASLLTGTVIAPETLAKFRDPLSGAPVSLGAHGELPLGTPPPIFLRRTPGASPASFAANLGTGGPFVVTGALTNAATSPTDPAAPVNTILPAISGAAIQGRTVAVSNGTWNNLPTRYAYQWMRDGAPITLAMAFIYLLTGADVGHSITCVVTATNAQGSRSAESAAIVPIAAGVPTISVNPAITGSTVENGTATLSTGTWTGSPLGYTAQWYRGAAPIGGATGFTYIYVTADVGQNITAQVIATNSSGPSAPATSNTVVPTGAPSGIPIPNPTALYAMFNAGVGASGGKTYLLAGIDFGDIYLSNYDFSSNPVIIKGQAGTVFTTLVHDNTQSITWDAFNVYGSYQGGAAVRVNNFSAHITFNQVSSNSGTAEGTLFGNGYGIRDSSYVTINGARDATIPDISGRGNAVAIQTSSHITLAGLTINNLGPDGILLNGLATGVIEGVLGFNFHPEPLDHPDFVQWFSVAGPNSNITIQNCGWERLIGDASQGYFGEGDSTNFVISGNWLYGGLFNSISQSGGATTLVDDNFVQGFSDYGSDIIGRDVTVDMIVTNNFTGAVTNYTAGGANPGFVPASGFGSNTAVGYATPGVYTDLDAWLATHPHARARHP